MSVEAFAEAFIGRLAADDFHACGSLAAYLARPEAERSGDEADVIDQRVTRTLLAALGYAVAEFEYNVGRDNLRPDYVVQIARYPLCCFVVEDKASTERALSSHRPQLAAYMTARRATRGLLINGVQLLGYDHAGPTTAATLDLPLAAAVRLWRGQDVLAGGQSGWAALTSAERDALTVLWRRYGRAAFDSLSRLIDDLTLDRDGTPHAGDGSSWRAGRTRIPLLDAAAASEALVGTVQDLIGELRADVAVQFAAREQEYAAFRREIETAPGSSAPAAAALQAHANALLDFLPPNDARREALRVRLHEAMRGERRETE
ncbi:MAG: hypothetical protein M0Z28_28905, partial [Rhodospirillales bacterium]|nr:hypothetical protein [Rhodospirillales bacterium]